MNDHVLLDLLTESFKNDKNEACRRIVGSCGCYIEWIIWL